MEEGLRRIAPGGVLIQNENYDAGLVRAGGKVRDQMTLINLSWRPVRVTTYPTCSCTVSDVTDIPVAPFHTCVMPAQVDTSGLRSGRHTRTIIIYLQSAGALSERDAHISFRIL